MWSKIQTTIPQISIVHDLSIIKKCSDGLHSPIQFLSSFFSEGTKNKHKISLNKVKYLSKDRIGWVCSVFLFAVLHWVNSHKEFCVLTSYTTAVLPIQTLKFILTGLHLSRKGREGTNLNYMGKYSGIWKMVDYPLLTIKKKKDNL